MAIRLFYFLASTLLFSGVVFGAPFDDLAVREPVSPLKALLHGKSINDDRIQVDTSFQPVSNSETQGSIDFRSKILRWLKEHEIPVQQDGVHRLTDNFSLEGREVEKKFHQFLFDLPWEDLSEFEDFRLETFLSQNGFFPEPEVRELIPALAARLIEKIPAVLPDAQKIQGFRDELEDQLQIWTSHATEQGDEIVLAKIRSLRFENRKLKKWLRQKAKKSGSGLLSRIFYAPSEKASLSDTVQGILRAIRHILRSIFSPKPKRDKIQVHFNLPPKSNQLDKFLLEALDTVLTHARPRLWMHLYQLNYEPVVNKIIEIAKQVGPEKVRLILEEHYIRSDFVPGDDGMGFREAYLKLREAGIEVRTDRYQGSSGSGQSHNKFFVINDNRLWTGSYNITRRGTFKNTNHGIHIQSKELNQIYADEFEVMWKGRFQKQKWNIVHRHEVSVDGTRIEVYFSPQDYVGDVIQKKLLEVNSSIEVAMFFLSDTELLNSLALQQERGVAINLLLDNLTLGVRLGQVSGKKRRLRDFLAENKIPFKKDGGGSHLHHKFAILDARTDSDPMVISGSHNWTKSAREKNDENILILHSREIALKFHNWWVQFYGEEPSIPELLPEISGLPSIQRLDRDGNNLKILVGHDGKRTPVLYFGKKACLNTEERATSLTCIIPGFFKAPKDGILDLRVTGLGTVDAFLFTNSDERISRATYRLWRRPLIVGEWEECSPDEPVGESCMFPIRDFPDSGCLQRNGDLNRRIDWRSCSQF
jgi:phosphatidylserine/phosphatidylglycerophosphate/cardiolipin synthase-like enzyme